MSVLSDQLKFELLSRTRVIAVVGLSPKPQRPSHRVAKYLQERGYQIVPVRPGVSEILNEKVYKNIADIPFKIDLLNVFRASEHVPAIIDECIQLKIDAVWLQEGIIHEQAAQKACQHGILMTMDKCIYKEIERLGVKPLNTQ